MKPPQDFKDNSKDFFKNSAYNISGLFFDYLPKFIPIKLVYLLLIAIPALIGYALGGLRGIWIAFWVVIWGLAIFFLGAYLWFSRSENWVVVAFKKLLPKKKVKKQEETNEEETENKSQE